jgi:MFS transporter, ACS family, hexuronate transporter
VQAGATERAAAPQAPVDQPSRAWAWKVCLFLLFATALSYLDRQALGTVAPRVLADLKLDKAQQADLLAAFFWSYGLGHLVVGWVLDRGNIRFRYAAFVALWSLSQMTAGLAQGFSSLFGSRVALGAFEAAGQPGAARIIARTLPARDRTLANGIMMSGGSVGAMIAGPLIIGLENQLGWRATFVVLGALGLVWALAFVLWFRPRGGLAPVVGQSLPREPWRLILRNPRFWACVGGALFGIPIIHVLSSWVPTYLMETWNVPLALGLGTYLLLIYLGLDLGFLGGGAAVSLLTRRGVPLPRARKMVLLAAGALMLLALLVPRAPNLGVAVALVALVSAGRACYGANFLAFNQEIAPGRVGTIAGLMGCIGSLSGGLLISIVGRIARSAGFGPVFLMLAGLAFLGLLPLMLVRWEGDTSR